MELLKYIFEKNIQGCIPEVVNQGCIPEVVKT